MRIIITLFVLGIFIIPSKAQLEGNIQGNILFKGYPYFVSMTSNGDILEFLRTSPEILNGLDFDRGIQPPVELGPYSKPTSKGATAEVYVSPNNTTVISDGDKVVSDMPANVKMSGEKSDNEKEMKTTVIRNSPKVEDGPEVITKQDQVEAKQLDFNYDLKFQGFTARLTPTLINQLKDISKDYEMNSKKQVKIRSFLTAGDSTNEKLARNRINACKNLLETYGVPSEKIEESIEPYRSSNSAQINITLE